MKHQAGVEAFLYLGVHAAGPVRKEMTKPSVLI